MRICVHDYVGHAFPIELSRSLAHRGHQVLHVYSSSRPSPHGSLRKLEHDAPGFEIEGISLAEPFSLESFWKRRKQEIEYGRKAGLRIRNWDPDVVIAAQTPTDSLKMIQEELSQANCAFVNWVQDIYGVAIHRILRKRIPLLGSLIGRWYMHLDRRALRRSDAVVVISDDFLGQMKRWGIDSDKIHVIENWASLDDLPPSDKCSSWSRRHGLSDLFCFLYAGTLGLKHQPQFLSELAMAFKNEANVRVVVISNGPGRRWLERAKSDAGLDNLVLMNWQPFEELPEVFGSSDVLIALLSEDAGAFSVPSKALSGFCAKRPQLLAVPSGNLAARIVSREEAGMIVEPTDMQGFLDCARRLYAEPDLRECLGANGRRYAEETFQIDLITDRFESVIHSACSHFAGGHPI